MAPRARVAILAVLALGCAGPDAAVVRPAMRSPATVRRPEPRMHACTVVPPPAGGGAVLSAELVAALHDESAPAIASAICACADDLGAALPETIRARAVLRPGRGEVLELGPLHDGGGVIVDTEGALDACVGERASRARLPVHVIGSDVQPDPDPTDERVVMPYVVAVSSQPQRGSRPR